MKTRIRTNPKKAVAIARDVLAQLRLKKFIAQSGVYFVMNEDGSGCSLDPWKDNRSLQDVIKLNTVACKVCAIGSIFASKVNLDNKLSVSEADNVHTEQVIDLTKNIFHPRDLYLMEYVFERGQVGDLADEQNNCDEDENIETYNYYYGMYFSFTSDELTRAKQYGTRYKTDETRLRTIMLNVIRNNGRFVIPKRIR